MLKLIAVLILSKTIGSFFSDVVFILFDPMEAFLLPFGV